MSSARIRVGIIGIGNQGKKHLKALKRLNKSGKIDLVGVCDLKYNSEYSPARYFKNYKKLFMLKPEIIVIATPNYLHKQMTIDALNAGIDVIKEKPLAMNLEDAIEILDFARSNGRIVAVMQQRFFHPTFIKAKEIIGNLGLPESFFYRLTLNDDNKHSWYWHYANGGGCWLNLGWHAISIINSLIDEAFLLQIFSKNGNLKKFSYDVDHVSFAKLLTEKGVKGSVLVSSVMQKEEYLKVDYPGTRLIVWNDMVYLIYKGQKIDLTPSVDKDQVYDQQMKFLIESIKEETYDSGKDLKIMVAIDKGLNKMRNQSIYYEKL